MRDASRGDSLYDRFAEISRFLVFVCLCRADAVKRLHGDHLSRAIGRIAGKDGKTKYTIENATKTRIVLAERCVGVAEPRLFCGAPVATGVARGRCPVACSHADCADLACPAACVTSLEQPHSLVRFVQQHQDCTRRDLQPDPRHTAG